MLSEHTDQELQDFFEEVWEVAEMAADCGDLHLFSYLLETAQDIADWRNEIRWGRAWAEKR